MKTSFIHILSVLILLAALSSLQSCREEINIEPPVVIIEDPPVELINTSISGQVKDADENIVQNADVRIGELQTQTDQNGYFSFKNIEADKNGTVLIVSKTGYIENRITVYPTLNHDLFSSITLKQDNQSVTKLNWTGGPVQLDENAYLFIESNTLVYELDGSNFTGEAIISYTIRDVSDPLFEAIFPGNLVGYSATNERKGLVPGAFIELSITDDQLRPLRLATGQTAEINLPLSEKYLENWPDEIQLYRFDSDRNRWYRSKDAMVLEANQYEGRLETFGTYCLAKEYDIVKLEGQLAYKEAISPARHSVEFRSSIQKPVQRFQTDEQGYFTAMVPAGTSLAMDVKNECGVVVLEENLAALEEDTEIAMSLVPVSNCRYLPVSGRLIDCTGNPVTKGYVRISSEENEVFIPVDNQGFFEGEFKVCDDNITVDFTALDMITESSTFRYEGFPVNGAIEIGTWRVCDESTGATGLQFKNQYFFVDEGIRFEQSTALLLVLADTEDLYIDCLITDFRGEDVYVIPNDVSAEFILTVLGEKGVAPALVPKDSLHLWTYKLFVERYIDQELIEGTIVGFARDDNNENAEGWFHLGFSVPLNE